MEIKLKPVKWSDGRYASRVNALDKEYLVRLDESGWVAQAADGEFFHESGHESREAAKAACEKDMLELCKYAVEVVPDHIPDATKMVNGWQDISTAPRDGTVIFLATPYGDEEGHWDDDQKQWLSERIDSSHGYEVELHPTHWLILPPLPKPPKEGER